MASTKAGDMASQVVVPASTLTPQPGTPAGATTPVSGGAIQLPKNVVEIELAPASAADDAQIVSHVSALVNKVYQDSEGGLWQKGHARTTNLEISNLIRSGSFAFAYLDEKWANGTSQVERQSQGVHGKRQIIGCIYAKLLSPTLGDLGVLALDETYRGGGLGSDLVHFAEDYCRQKGCTVMQLELLVPTTFELSMKKRLQDWYMRMGYQVVGLVDFQVAHPLLAPDLLGPVDYKIFEKPLV